MNILDMIFKRDYTNESGKSYKEDVEYEVVQPQQQKEKIRRVVYNMTSPMMSVLDGYSKRAYQAASANRTLSGWNGSYLTANEETQSALTILRARSRDLELNNNYMLKFLAAVVTNIVGSKGFTLQVKIKNDDGTLDTLANSLIEEGFHEWESVCDVSNRNTFKDLTRLIIRTVARDGECLLLKIRDTSINKFGYSLQFIDIDRLALNLNKRLDNGNIISMGIETDQYQRVVAYWINTDFTRPSNQSYTQFQRFESKNVFHIYRPNRAEQFRGVPWCHSVLATLEMIGGYQEASVIKRRTAAGTMGFYKTKTGDVSEVGFDAVDTDDKDDEEKGEYLTYADPGKFSILPEGVEFQAFDPQSNDDYDVFIKSLLRAIAAALGVSYHTLANDLENVNFSSIRAGVLEERDLWMTTQDWFISQFLMPVYKDWLQEALTNGALAYPSGKSLPIEKIKKFSDIRWTGRRWSWVNPLQEIQAAKLRLDTMTATRSDILQEQGLDFEEIVAQRAYEDEAIKKAGIILGDSTELLNNLVTVEDQQNSTNTNNKK